MLVATADAVASDDSIPQVVAEAACLPLGSVRIVGLAILGGEGSGEVEGFECFACELWLTRFRSWGIVSSFLSVRGFLVG